MLGPALGWITATSVVEAIGLYYVKLGGPLNTLLASLLYGAGVIPLLSRTVQYEGIGIVNFLWNILSTLLGFVIGLLYFKERIHSLQVIGVGLSLLGIGCILLAPRGSGDKP